MLPEKTTDIREFTTNDYDSIASWEDVEYVDQPTPAWLEYVTSQNHVSVLVAEEDFEVSGYCQFDVEESIAYCAIVVKRDHRRRGVGRKLHLAMVKRLHELEVRLIRANVEVENVVSLRAFTSYGFTQRQIKDGLVELELVRCQP